MKRSWTSAVFCQPSTCFDQLLLCGRDGTGTRVLELTSLIPHQAKEVNTNPSNYLYSSMKY